RCGLHRREDRRLPAIEGSRTGKHQHRSPLDRKELVMHEPGSHHHEHVAALPRETEGLPEARRTELVEPGDGDEFELKIVPVKKQIGDATVRMLAYNGSVPGP